MPTSFYSNLTSLCSLIESLAPSTILDIGVGNGRFGFLARDLLDVMHLSDKWKTRIDGIEVFPDYIKDHQRYIYDTIHTGDAIDVIDRLGNYDFIYLGDVLEHFTKADGWILLDKVAAHCAGYIGMGIPIGGNWEQEEIYGNPYEEHKSVWELSDFNPFVEQNWLYSDPDNPSQCSYALLKIKPDQLQKHRKRIEADKLCQLGNHLEAIALLSAMSAEGEPDIVTDFQLTDLLLQSGRSDEAIEVLTRCRDNFPDELAVGEMLERLRKS